jgi:hypothetical protein
LRSPFFEVVVGVSALARFRTRVCRIRHFDRDLCVRLKIKSKNDGEQKNKREASHKINSELMGESFRMDAEWPAKRL